MAGGSVGGGGSLARNDARAGSVGASHEPPSLIGRAPAPAFEIPAVARARAPKQPRLRTAGAAGGCVLDCDATDDGSQQQGSGGGGGGGGGGTLWPGGRRPPPRGSAPAVLPTEYPWLHLVRVEALWDPVTGSRTNQTLASFCPALVDKGSAQGRKLKHRSRTRQAVLK